LKTAGVVAFAFGAPETILSNRRIAIVASQKARELCAPVYTQLDVRVESGIQVEYTEEEPGNPPPTLRIARGAVQWAKRHGFTMLFVVAAKPHLWRALRDVRAAVREDGARIGVRACDKGIAQYPGDSWFCPDSAQARTRSSEVWNKRENILKCLPFFVYKRVAS
jgi:hypothetical protein